MIEVFHIPLQCQQKHHAVQKQLRSVLQYFWKRSDMKSIAVHIISASPTVADHITGKRCRIKFSFCSAIISSSIYNKMNSMFLQFFTALIVRSDIYPLSFNKVPSISDANNRIILSTPFVCIR